MIISEMRTSEIHSGWHSVDVGTDSRVAVFDGGGALWVEIQNGATVKGVLISRESADALFNLLGVKLGYIEDPT